MRSCTNWILAVSTILCVSFSGQSVCTAGSKGEGKRILVRIPAFSMAADEKIMGVKINVKEGSVFSVFKPRSWVCEASGVPGVDDTMYCYSPVREYAIIASSMLPEITVSDPSGSDPGRFRVEATVEIEGNDGKRHEKQIRHSELRISR